MSTFWIPVSSFCHYAAMDLYALALRLRRSSTFRALRSASYAILGTDALTADVYGRVKHDLKLRGLTMPDNDLWIAATALQYDVMLAAREAHFNWLTGLRVEQW